MTETQLAKIAAAIPSHEKDRILGKPEGTMETTNLQPVRLASSFHCWFV